MSFGLKRFKEACLLFSDPQKSFKSIHIAGTNGKGSTSLKIAKGLKNKGYKVGLYTSPHLSTFRERIQVDFTLIEEEVSKDILDDIFLKCPSLTFFEVITLLAFIYFKNNKVDFAVIEAGLGGRLDATNVIEPLLSVITSIAFDHMDYLGNTLDEIAFEKGGIIKSHVPVVLGVKAQKFQNLIHIANQENAPIILASHTDSIFYDDENSMTAKAALKVFGIEDDSALQHRPKCRFEKVGSLILDVAHNPDGLLRTFQYFKFKYPDKKIIAALGMSEDKDYKKALEVSKDFVDEIYFIKGSSLKSLNPEHLLSYWNTITNKKGEVALDIKALMNQSIVTLALGSFYIMHEIRIALGINEPSDAKSVYELGQRLEPSNG
jgi:dihydrofolate synthase/folylpolyglutamate synthase